MPPSFYKECMKRLATLILFLCSISSFAELGDQGLRNWTLNSATDGVGCAQSGTWTTNSTVSGSVSCSQASPPWSVSQSGAWTTGRTWSLVNTSDSVNAVQSGTWTTGRTWALASGTDSIASVQSGTWTTAQGTPNTTANAWPMKITDGTNIGAVKAASTAPLATDPSQVVSISPNNQGQGTNTTSLPVVLSSNQTGINSFLDKNQTGTISALNGTVTINTNGMATVILTLTGTWSATINLQGFDGTNWIGATGLTLPAGGITSALSANGSIAIPVGGFSQFRIQATVYTSGTVNAFMNTGSGLNVVQVYNDSGSPIVVKGNGTAGTPDTNVVTVQGVSGGTGLASNITQFGTTNISTGTGASGAGIPRVTVANDSKIIAWDGTNTTVVKAGSTQATITDPALVITGRPDNVGTPTQTSVSCAATSTTLLAASTASMFLSIRNPTTSTVTIWINVTGAAAVAAAPSLDLPPGSEAYFSAEGSSFLPTSQINCISGGSASSVTITYK